MGNLLWMGIDQSKRSTGVVFIDGYGKLESFLVIAPPMEMDGVELFKYQWDSLEDFIWATKEPFDEFGGGAIEGLSLASRSSQKDLLAGLQWHIRANMFSCFGHDLGVIPVSSWRSTVLTKAERREAKAGDGLKEAVVAKLPDTVRERFTQYLQEHGYKKTSIYDLADAYFIAQYRRQLSINE